MATHEDNRNHARWPIAALGVAMGAVIGGITLLTTALAVHQPSAPFELDGDATQTTADDDWNNVFNLPTPYPTPRGTPVTGDGETFVMDGANLAGGKETSAWSGSNKDIDLISTWEYKAAKVVPDKDNITNAYAKAYSVGGFPGPNTEHLVIYFGADRFANNGDAALGFWFFKDDVALAANGQFSGEHVIGDILVQIDFVNGGAMSEVQIFEWVGSGGSHGSLNELAFDSSNGLTVCTDDDTACATSNAAATDSPWAYTPKSGTSNVFPAQSFFEAGIDITALVGEVCFSSFMAETRSSHSETAELKDFALGDFDLCSIDVEKVCVNDGGVTSPIVDPVDETFQTRHTVTITDDGFGPIYDIALRDDKVAAGKVCSISEITGDGIGTPTIPPGGILFPDSSTYVDIADQLNAGGSITVTLICVTDDNPFANGVTVRSAPNDGGTADVTDSDQESPTEAAVCEKTLDVGLKLLKFCQGDRGTNEEPNTQYQAGDLSVFLNPANNYAPEVCVDIALSNTTNNQRMVITSFSDTDVGDLLPPGGLTLEPSGTAGDTYNVSKCYTPTAPDNDETNPGLATYSDTVSATGKGKINNVSVDATPKTATCKLCPTCPDCPPSG